jgi:hypothetical protein
LRALHSWICFLLLAWSLSNQWGCDLNHDWKLVQTQTHLELQPQILLKGLKDHFSSEKNPILVLDIKNIFQRNSAEPEGSREQEKGLMTYGFLQQGKDNIYFRNPSKISRKELFESQVLQKLTEGLDLVRLISLKLTRYLQVEQRFQDRYAQNKNVFRESRLHDLEFSYAVLNTEGRYLSFEDVKLKIEEISTFQEGPKGNRTYISLKGFDPLTKLWKEEEYFLGLEAIEGLAQTVLNRFGLIQE